MFRISDNAILARWARDALREYDRVSGGGCTETATIHLLMASLAHLADQFDNMGAGERAFKEAIKLYKSELTAE